MRAPRFGEVITKERQGLQVHVALANILARGKELTFICRIQPLQKPEKCGLGSKFRGPFLGLSKTHGHCRYH